MSEADALARRRLLHRERRLRARVPARTRRPVGQGQGLRHLRPDRPVAGDRGRGRRPAGARDVARGRWRAATRTASTQHDDLRVATLVSYISQFMSLQPGDVISTGTPPGVGLGQKPAGLSQGRADRCRLGITGLGEQRQRTMSATVGATHEPARHEGPRGGYHRWSAGDRLGDGGAHAERGAPVRCGTSTRSD